MTSTKNNQKQIQRNWIRRYAFRKVEKMFNECDIKIGGDRPEDIKVHNENFFMCLVLYVTGLNRKILGECYTNGYYDVDDIAACFEKLCQYKEAFNKLSLFVSHSVSGLPMLFLNMQSKRLSKKDIAAHYDIGNDLFKLMLDRSMNYSCGYWQKFRPSEENPDIMINTICDTLEEAQLNKMFLIARKLNLQPGMTVLDIGCGWGYLCKFLALNFGVNVVGVTISKQQVDYATTTDLELEKLDFLRIPGLKQVEPGTVEIEFKDYRDVKEKFDRIISVGMIEHVGKKNYNQFFKIANKCLKDDGLFLLHTIGIGNNYMPQIDPWANSYIFPGGMLPYHTQLIKAMHGLFLIEDWHNFGSDYSRTLDAWSINFKNNWHKIENQYDEKFRRTWNFYLGISSGLFKARKFNLWQIVLSKDGYKNYASVR